MSDQSTSSTDDMPLLAQRPRDPSIDLGAALHLATMRREFAGADASPPQFREWEVERKLGDGGMGTVYLARHRELGRRVALKLVKAGDTGDAQARAARIIREAQALARVDHENVLRIHQVDTSGERTVIEMEFIDGPTLREWQQQPGRSWRTIVAAYADAGDGLAAIHRAGLLHRDIKPDNVLIDANGRIRVADLGLAVARRGSNDEADEGGERGDIDENSVLGLRLTADGGWVGTPGYMAPEVIAGGEASEASDQFSLAVSLYEAVYGTRPFAGESPRELAAAMQEGRLSKARDKRWRPRWLARVLRRALRFDPNRRHPSVAAFVGALRRRLRLPSWIAGGVGLVALVGGATTLGWYGKPAPDDPCVAAGDEMSTIWNDTVRAELGRKVDEGSTRASELLVQTLDARATAWSDTRGQLCVVQSKRDPQLQAAEADIDARQLACLRHTRIHIEAVIAQLRGANDDLARQFTEAAAAIEALPTCEERRHLVHWPLDVGEDDEADTQLAQALALETAGRYSEAEAMARRVAEASSHDDPLRHAEALYRLGHVLGLARRDRSAFEVLDEARNVAFTIGHDELFCRAVAFQAKLSANVRQDPAAAGRELGLARACVARLGARSPILRAELLEARGLLAYAAGDPSAAVTWHEQALALRREHLGEDHLSTVKSLHNLANAMTLADSSNERADEILGMYGQCLDLRTRVLGEVHPDVADLLFDLGRFLAGRGQPEQGRDQLEQAGRIFALVPGEHELSRVKVHLALALIAIETGDYAKAEVQLGHARSLLSESDGAELQRASLLHIDGALALRRQDYARAADASRRATTFYRRHDPGSEAALDSLVDEIAAAYGLRDYMRVAAIARDEADVLPTYLRSLVAEERGPLAWYVADALVEQENPADAKMYFAIAIESYESLGDSASVVTLRARLE